MNKTKPNVSVISSTNLPLIITGIVFWGMILIGILISWFLINDYQTTLTEKYNLRVKSAVFDISKILIQNPNKSLLQLEDKIDKVREENQLLGVLLEANNSSVMLGAYTKDCSARSISLLTQNPNKNTLSVCMHNMDDAIATYRKNILIVMAVLFFSFGFVLQSILQKLLTKPFIDMVDKANRITGGKSNERFDELRNDEFGFLAKFINQALDVQIQQSRELAHVEQASKAKSIFLTNMSHELRTPLNAIIGYSEMLTEEISDVEHQKDLKNIINSGRHLLTLINDLLDLSKIEAGKIDVSTDKVSIPILINDVVDTIRPIIKENHNRIKIYCPPGVLFITSDHTKIKQILFNLLSNASKFTQNGKISLRTLVNENNQIQFSVKDTGIGLSQEQMKNIFNTFTQADDSIQKRYGGSGLGLAISKHYARLMGGDIVVTSKKGVGSTFTFYLPFENDSENTNTTKLTASS